MSILQSILAVFLSVGEWISSAVNTLTPMFWVAETGLTFLGTLAVAGLSFSVAFLEYFYYINDNKCGALQQ